MIQFSGVTIIISINFGILTFILLFIFAKRQILRFSLKNRRGIHTATGYNAPKTLRNDIEKKIDIVKGIANEPRLQTNENLTENQEPPAHLYRMKTLDSLCLLDAVIAAAEPSKSRHVGEDLQHYLLSLHAAAMMPDLDPAVIGRFTDLYRKARHLPDEYGASHYQEYMELLNQIQKSVVTPKRKIISQFGNTKLSPSSLLTPPLKISALANLCLEKDLKQCQQNHEEDEAKVHHQGSPHVEIAP